MFDTFLSFSIWPRSTRPSSIVSEYVETRQTQTEKECLYDLSRTLSAGDCTYQPTSDIRLITEHLQPDWEHKLSWVVVRARAISHIRVRLIYIGVDCSPVSGKCASCPVINTFRRNLLPAVDCFYQVLQFTITDIF